MGWVCEGDIPYKSGGGPVQDRKVIAVHAGLTNTDTPEQLEAQLVALRERDVFSDTLQTIQKEKVDCFRGRGLVAQQGKEAKKITASVVNPNLPTMK